MGISIPIPNSWKLPLFFAAVDGSKAGNLSEDQPALLFGHMQMGQAAAVLKSGSTGNGTIAMDSVYPVSSGALLGIYKAKFTSATAFTVTDPNNVTIGAGTLVSGMATFANQVGFKITAGSTAFVNNDEFDITVARLVGGVASQNRAIPISSVAMGKYQFGEGSMLARMVELFLAGNSTQELWAMPIPDPAAGQYAAGSITINIAGTNPQSGLLSTYIAGQAIPLTVYGTDTGAIIATNLAALINATASLPVTAAVDGTLTNKVNLTAKWRGLTGNDTVVKFNYYGLNGGEAYPVGLTTTVVPMSGGSGNPDFTAAISALAQQQFLHVAMPWTDAASERTWDTEYGFGPSGRWSFPRQQYGWIFQAYRNDYADAMVWGIQQNSSVISTFAVELEAPAPIWEWSAAYCAQASAALLADPAAPLHYLQMPGILPAKIHDRFAQTELNNLANNGFALQGVDASGVPIIIRESTQYQKNSYGQGDDAFALITVLSNLAELLSRMRSAITSKYGKGYKLAADGTRFAAGQKIITPKIAKAELVAEARQAEYDGLMQNVDQFIKALIVEIPVENPNRLNVLWPPQLMGQLRQFDMLAQFRLRYNPVTGQY